MTEKEIEHICNVYKTKFPDRSLDFYKVGVAQEMLRIMIDNEWVNQALYEQHPNKPRKTQEARTYLKSKTPGFEWQERIFKLAERIYNLQNVVGISRIIDEIKNGGLTSRYAELDAARHLYTRNIHFDFVAPSGVRGKDFDIKIRDTVEVNCEVKHKIESTKLSAETIRDALENAGSQVPAAEPALIFVKIPETWIEDSNLGSVVNVVTDSFFKNSTQVLGIVFRWEIHHPLIEGGFLWGSNLIGNHFYDGVACNNLLDKLQSDSTNWIFLEDLIKKYI